MCCRPLQKPEEAADTGFVDSVGLAIVHCFFPSYHASGVQDSGTLLSLLFILLSFNSTPVTLRLPQLVTHQDGNFERPST
jgi:hypothetical protein